MWDVAAIGFDEFLNTSIPTVDDITTFLDRSVFSLDFFE